MIRKLSSALIKPLLITYKIDFYWKTSNVRAANSFKWRVMIQLLHYFYTIKALTWSLVSEIKLSKANKKQRHWLNIYQWLKEIAKWIPLSLVRNETHTELTNSIKWLYTNCGRSHSQMTPEFDAITVVLPNTANTTSKTFLLAK